MGKFGNMLETGIEPVFSLREQKIELAREMWFVRKPDLLDKKIIEYLDIQGLPSENVRLEYEKERYMLKDLFGDSDVGLKKDLLYHGTGMFKYSKDKYGSEVTKGEVSKLFEDILDNGMKVQPDPWMPQGDMQSISLADSYFYAKWFAFKHMTDDCKPAWQLGNPNDYFRFFMADTFLSEINPTQLPITIFKYLKNRGSILSVRKSRKGKYPNKLKSWTSSFKNGDEESVFDLLDGNSDIFGNFGLVICLEKDAIDFDKPLFAGAHEVRSQQDISIEAIRAVGVPIRKVDEVIAMLIEKGKTNIRVFALECADLHFAQFKIQDLVERVIS